MTDRLIRITTALAVVTVPAVAAVISYRHAYELVSTHGETDLTARLVPFTSPQSSHTPKAIWHPLARQIFGIRWHGRFLRRNSSRSNAGTKRSLLSRSPTL